MDFVIRVSVYYLIFIWMFHFYFESNNIQSNTNIRDGFAEWLKYFVSILLRIFKNVCDSNNKTCDKESNFDQENIQIITFPL